jgi:K+-sensing histidine kinase KdpD
MDRVCRLKAAPRIVLDCSNVRKDHLPYLAATAYSLLVSALVASVLNPPPPRFMDLYLIGIMLATLWWSWKPAAVIYLISLAVAAWILPPIASMAVSSGPDQYRMFSYTVTAVVAINVIELSKKRRR